jgi:transposase
MILNNLFMNLLKGKGIASVDASESGFSSDKRTTGGSIYQRRKDGKETTSGFCKGLIHNLMLLHG